MILENLKIQKVIDKIIMDGLKEGKVINSVDFKTHLSQELKKHDLSKPFFQFTNQNNSYTIDTYNKSKEELEMDLSSFFETMVLCYQKLQYNILKYDSIKTSKINYINELERQLKELIFQSSPNNLFAQYKESILNMDNISDQSTVVVDSEKHEALLRKEGHEKIELVNPKVNITKGFKYSKTNNGTKNIYAITSDKQGSVTLGLEYTLNEEEYISSINITADYIKETKIKIYVNDVRVFEDKNIKTKTIEINEKVNKIKIELTKEEADKYHGDSIVKDNKRIEEINKVYEYYFIVGNIVCMVNSYNNSGVFISNPISLPSASSYVKIDPEDYIPENTEINYFYKLNNQDWNKYEKESIVYINREHHFIKEILFKEKKFNNSNFSLRQLYYLTENIDANINSNTIKKIELYEGYNQWKREIYLYGSELDDKFGATEALNYENFKKYVSDYKKYGSYKLYEDSNNIVKNTQDMKQYILKVQKATEGMLTVLKDSENCELVKEDYVFVKDNVGDIALNEQIYNKGFDNKSVLYKYTTYIENETVIDISLDNCYWDDDSYITMEIDGNLFYDVYSLSPGNHRISIYIKPGIIEQKTMNGETIINTNSCATETTCFFDIADKGSLKFISANKDALSPSNIEEIRFKKDIGDSGIRYCFDNQNIYITSNSNTNYLLDINYVESCQNNIEFKAELSSNNNKCTPKLYGYELIVG